MLAFNDEILITLEKSQFRVLNLKTKKNDCIKIEPYSLDETLGYVLAGAVSLCGEYICISDDFKRLILYRNLSDNWVLTRKCILDRRCSNIKFSLDMQNILIADKSGYLLKFPLEFPDLALNNEENRLKFIAMGHISVLIDFDIHPQQILIATADRDEKIRLSHYPNCYEIYTFLLGHTRYLTQVTFSEDGRYLYSTAADGYLILWDLSTKKEICRYKYHSNEDEKEVPIVTRMYINDNKIFLFFKNESNMQIISKSLINGEMSLNSHIVDLGLSVIDVSCHRNDNDFHFVVISKSERGYKLKNFVFENFTKVSMRQLNWVEDIDMSDCLVYERNKFLDSLCKTSLDKTGVEVYYEKKSKRIKLTGDHESTDEENEDD